MASGYFFSKYTTQNSFGQNASLLGQYRFNQLAVQLLPADGGHPMLLRATQHLLLGGGSAGWRLAVGDRPPAGNKGR